MSRRRSTRSAIHRIGKEVDILEPSTTSSNQFNNPETSWSETGTTQCVRTYPNRNTEVNRGGEFERDRPVFLFSTGEEPPSNSRIRYEGILYELQSPTVYDTHVAMFGNRVDNN